jgi:DNA-binding YbaB/EbfC family protein
MNSLSKMKKQAYHLQEQFSKMQEEMETLEVTGSAGNNLVQVILSGDKTLKKISIHPECVDPEDVEGLQDLIMAAFADAQKKLEEQSPVGSLLNNLPIGNLPF